MCAPADSKQLALALVARATLLNQKKKHVDAADDRLAAVATSSLADLQLAVLSYPWCDDIEDENGGLYDQWQVKIRALRTKMQNHCDNAEDELLFRPQLLHEGASVSKPYMSNAVYVDFAEKKGRILRARKASESEEI